MTNDPTKITDEEIVQYQQQFANFSEALDALDLIYEYDGDLEKSASLLALQTGVSVTRQEPNILDELAQKCHQIICDDAFIDDLMSGLLTAGVTALSTSGQIPAAVATPIVIYLTKKGVKKWCRSHRS